MRLATKTARRGRASPSLSQLTGAHAREEPGWAWAIRQGGARRDERPVIGACRGLRMAGGPAAGMRMMRCNGVLVAVFLSSSSLERASVTQPLSPPIEFSPLLVLPYYRLQGTRRAASRLCPARSRRPNGVGLVDRPAPIRLPRLSWKSGHLPRFCQSIGSIAAPLPPRRNRSGMQGCEESRGSVDLWLHARNLPTTSTGGFGYCEFVS